jgi:phosphatidylserine/phosphatidylglycerophosphate/cardiolipin synthase-like enzyme
VRRSPIAAAAGIFLAVLVALTPQAIEVSGSDPAARASAAVDPCQPNAAGALPANCVAWLPGWRPQLGPVFNDPLRGDKSARAIVTRLVKAINHTRRGSLIRIAVYSFDRGDVLAALRRARKRGVFVQVIVNKSVMSDGARGLQKLLGKNPRKRNFVVACDGRCRKKGSGGNMHAKVYTFSRTGGAQYLVITGSGNLTSKGVYRQWNDSYGVANDKKLYDTWGVMFNQMARQRSTTARRLSYTTTTGGYNYTFQRALASQGGQVATSQTVLSRYRAAADPAWKRIQKVSCVAPKGYGVGGRTAIRIAMYGMFKSRGEALAKALVRKKQQGCDIKVIMSVPGGHTYKVMERAGIPLRSADWQFAERNAAEEDGISGFGPRFYSHLKFMAINGGYAAGATTAGTRTVWTGSENWDSLSFANEEFVLTVNDASVYRQYVDRWNSMWNGRATHAMGIKPLRAP